MARTKVDAILWSRKDKNGLCPVRVRITVDGKRAYIPLGFSVAKDDWNNRYDLVKDGHPFAASYNNTIKVRRESATSAINRFELDRKHFNATTIKTLIEDRMLAENVQEAKQPVRNGSTTVMNELKGIKKKLSRIEAKLSAMTALMMKQA